MSHFSGTSSRDINYTGLPATSPPKRFFCFLDERRIPKIKKMASISAKPLQSKQPLHQHIFNSLLPHLYNRVLEDCCLFGKTKMSDNASDSNNSEQQQQQQQQQQSSADANAQNNHHQQPQKEEQSQHINTTEQQQQQGQQQELPEHNITLDQPDENLINKSFQVAKDSSLAPADTPIDATTQASSSNTNNNTSSIDNALKEKDPSTVSNDQKITDKNQLSSFLAISGDDVNCLNDKVLNAIRDKLVEFENLQSDNTLLNVKLGQVSHSSQKKIESLGKTNNELSFMNAKLKNDNSDLQNANSGLNKKIIDLNFEISKLKNENSSLTLAINNSSESSKSNLQIITKVTDENLQLRKEVDEAKNKSLQLRSEMISRETSIKNLENEIVGLKFENEDLKNKLNLTDKNLQWYKSELDGKIHESTKFKSQKSEQITRLQSEFDAIKAEKNRLTARISTLEQSEASLQQKLERSIFKFEQLNSSHILDSENFFNEISSKDKLIEILKDSNETIKKRIDSITEEYHNESSKLSDRISKLNEQIEQQQQQLVEREAKVQELENTLDQLTTEDQLTLSVPNNSQASNNHLTLSSTSKQLAHKVKGLSLSELFSEYTLLKKQLISERRLKESMQEQIDGFIVELEQKIPLIEITNNRNQFLENQLVELSKVLEQESFEKTTLSKQLEQTQQEKNELHLQISSLLKIKLDLSKQVQYLLIQLALANDKTAEPLTDYEKSEIDKILNDNKVSDKYLADIQREIHYSGVVESDTDKLISSRLVIFKDINELQIKNRELINIVRSLGSKLEMEEASKKISLTKFESATIDEAKEAIKTLQEEIESLEIRLTSSQRERDLFRLIADSRKHSESNGNANYLLENNNNQSNQDQSLLEENSKLRDEIKNLEAHLTNIKTESKKIIDELSMKTDSFKNEKSSLLMQIYELKSSETILKERYNNISNNLEFKTKESSELKQINDKLNGTLTKQEAQISSFANEVFSVKSELNVAQNEIRNLKAEKDLLESIKSRSLKENDELKSEKQSLNKLLENLQHINLGREADFKSSNERLLNQTKAYETELQSTKETLAKVQKELREAELKQLNDSGVYQEKINGLNNQLLKVKDSLHLKSNELEVHKNKIDLLEKQILSSKDYINNISKPRTEASDNISEEDKLHEEIKNLQQQLNNAKEDLLAANNDVAQFKQIANSAEESLSSMNASFEQYKAKSEESIKKSNERVLELSKSIESLTNDKNSLEEKLMNYEVENNKLNTNLESLSAKVKTTEEIKKEFDSKMDGVKKDLDRHVRVQNELKQNYENELTKHAETIKKTKSLQLENQTMSTKLSEISSKLEAVEKSFDNSKNSWESQKEDLEEQISASNARVEEYLSQNKVLLDQLESVNNREKINVENVNEDEAKDHELRKVITFLRKEKDVVAYELESKTQENIRISIELNKAKDELLVVKSKIDDLERFSSDAEKFKQENDNLLSKLEHLNLLRESNVTLRNELKLKDNLISDLENKTKLLSSGKAPLENEVARLKSDISVKEQDIKLLYEENANWKRRLDSLLKTYNKIDPNEYAELQKKVEELAKSNAEIEKEKQDLSGKITRLRTEFQSKLQSRSKEAKEFRNEIDALKKELEKKNGEFNAKIATLEKEKKELTDNVTNLNIGSGKGGLKHKLNEATKQLHDSKNKLTEVYKERNSFESRIKVLESQIVQLKKEKDENEQKQVQIINKLKQDLSTREKQVENLSKPQSQPQAANNVVDSENTAAANKKLTDEITQLKQQFEQEKAQLKNEFISEKNQEIAKLKERYSKLDEAAGKGESTEGGSNTAVGSASTPNVEELKNKWLEEHEKEVKGRIEAALDDQRAKFTLPTKQRVDLLANQKFQEFIKKHKNEIKSNSEKHVKAEYDEKIQNLEKKHKEQIIKLTDEFEKKISSRVEAELKKRESSSSNKQADPEDLKKLREFLANKHQENISELNKKHEQELNKQFASGQKASGLKMKLLEGKIKKLTDELSKYKGSVPSSANSSPVKFDDSPVKSEQSGGPQIIQTQPLSQQPQLQLQPPALAQVQQKQQQQQQQQQPKQQHHHHQPYQQHRQQQQQQNKQVKSIVTRPPINLPSIPIAPNRQPQQQVQPQLQAAVGQKPALSHPPQQSQQTAQPQQVQQVSQPQQAQQASQSAQSQPGDEKNEKKRSAEGGDIGSGDEKKPKTDN